MSYAPSTRLSIGSGDSLEQVLVLTGGRVVLEVLGGKPHREFMTLDDWLIMAGDNPICVNPPSSVTTPSIKPEPVNTMVASVVPSLVQAAVLPEPEPEPIYSKGTLLRWINDDSRRVAIVLENQVLQVKCVVNGALQHVEGYSWRAQKTFFDTVAAWKASLPEGGAITAEERPTGTSVEQKLQMPSTAQTDHERVIELCQRFKVNAHVIPNPSYNQMLERYLDSIKDCRQTLAGISLEDDIADPSWRAKVSRRITSDVHRYNMFKEMWSTKTPEEMAEPRNYLLTHGRQRLFAYKDLNMCPIGPYLFDGERKIAMQMHGRMVVGSSFTELGVDMVDGKPKLEVSYRGRWIRV